MNFMKLYMGDYQRDTAHLSVTEHGAYHLMLQHFYATEKPLPLAGPALYRMLRAQEKHEREAIDLVAAQFWRITPEGLVNDRALKEIAKAEHQRTVNREIGKRGGRPPKAGGITESVSRSDPNRGPIGEPNRNPPQTPDTRLNTESASALSARAPDDPFPNPSASPAESLSGSPPGSLAGSVCARMKAVGLAGVNPSHPMLLHLLAGGVTGEELVAAAVEAVHRGKSFAYALATAKGRRDDAASTTVSTARPGVPAESARERWNRERAAAFAPGLERKPPGAEPNPIKPATEIFDAAPTRLLG